MRVLRASVGATVLLAGQLVVAGGASATPSVLTVSADQPSAVPIGHNWSFNDFFPRRLTVHTGATVDFELLSFHTATLLPAGVSSAQGTLAHPIAVADTDDANRNPNGTTTAALNAGALLPTSFTCGTSLNPCAYDGSSLVSSGVPQGPTGSFYATITAKPGTYTFICLVHPKMHGTIHVVDADDRVDTATSVAARAATQIKSDVLAGRAAESAANHARLTVDDGVRTWWLKAGTGTPDGHVAILEMLPRSVDIRKGDRVAWTSPAVNEPHTVTFPVDMGSEFQPSCEGAGGVDTPAAPNHLPPQGLFDFNCGGGPFDEVAVDGGNGVRTLTSNATVSDSGFLTSRTWNRLIGLPQSGSLHRWTVSIAANATAGTYTYVCQIHDGMAGALVVH